MGAFAWRRHSFAFHFVHCLISRCLHSGANGIFLNEISSVTVRAPLFGVERAVVTTVMGYNWHVYFFGRESRLWFLYLVEELQPQIIVYRRR
jgi:hypothetical protein